MTVGFSASSEQPIMFGPAAGSGNPLALPGSCVGCVSHVGWLYAVKEASYSVLIMLFKFACHGWYGQYMGQVWTPDSLWACSVCWVSVWLQIKWQTWHRGVSVMPSHHQTGRGECLCVALPAHRLKVIVSGFKGLSDTHFGNVTISDQLCIIPVFLVYANEKMFKYVFMLPAPSAPPLIRWINEHPHASIWSTSILAFNR